MAAKASSHSQPVNITNNNPMTTPPDVQTSVTKCLASASNAIERCCLATLNITQASKPFKAELATDKDKPHPNSIKG